LNGPNGLAFNSAGNLFETDLYSGDINEFTPGGVQSTFASGLSNSGGLTFNSANDLFVSDYYRGNIYEFTPGGVQSTFVSGLNSPFGLAFQAVPEPTASGLLAVGITAFLIRRRHTILATPH
jgi:hypothetical protein